MYKAWKCKHKTESISIKHKNWISYIKAFLQFSFISQNPTHVWLSFSTFLSWFLFNKPVISYNPLYLFFFQEISFIHFPICKCLLGFACLPSISTRICAGYFAFWSDSVTISAVLWTYETDSYSGFKRTIFPSGKRKPWQEISCQHGRGRGVSLPHFLSAIL